jgi:DNA-binding GntR family transcriptional regulator
MAEVIRLELRKGGYQMPGDTLPYETQAAKIAEVLAANGYGKLTAVQLAARDKPESMEAARGQVRAERRAAHAGAIREARAQALDDAAEEFNSRLPDGTGNGRAYNSYRVAELLRARAVTERGGE